MVKVVLVFKISIWSVMEMRTQLLLTASIVALMTAGCGGGSKSSTPTERATTNPVKKLTQAYQYQVIFKNVLDGSPITDKLNVEINGAAANKVVDGLGKKIAKTEVTNGMLTLAADLNDSDMFSIVAGNRTLGWQESGIQVKKSTSKAGIQVLEILLVNTKNTAAINDKADLGVAIISENNIASLSGLTRATPTKTTKNAEGNSVSVGTATIALPEGIKALDASGKEINITQGVSLTAIKFSNDEASALAAFPGGFTPTVTQANGTTANTGAFITGGFAQFNLTDNATGQAIKKFDKDIELGIDLPKGSKDPSGKVLVAGDKYDVWSFNESNGTWVFETSGTIEEKDANNFTVKFKTNHLSYWNLDFYVDTCTATLNLNRSASDTRPLTVTLIGEVGERFSRDFWDVTDSTQTIFNYPSNTRVHAQVRDEDGSLIVQTTSPVNLCSGANLTVPVSTKPIRNITVNVTESCPSGSNSRPALSFMDAYNQSWTYLGGAYATTTTFNTSSTSGYIYVYNARNWAEKLIRLEDVPANGIVNVNFNDLQCTTTPATGGTGTGGTGSGS